MNRAHVMCAWGVLAGVTMLLPGSALAEGPAAAAPAAAQVAPAVRNAAYLKIDGVPGSSTDPQHSGWIEISSFSWGATNTSSDAQGRGGGTGKAKLSDIQITKKVDAASPVLFQALTSGRHYKEVVIELRKSGGQGSPYYRVTMSDVLVAADKTSAGDRPTEALTLNFTKIEVKSSQQKSDGTPGAFTTAPDGWDIQSNVKI
jgi:type VI secretion system secreted protein Hcp